MHITSPSLNPYHLAGVLDKSLTLRFRGSEGPVGTVRGPRSLLYFIQQSFGGKVSKYRHECLTLHSGSLESIAQYLSSTSCVYSRCYQLILRFKTLKETFYNRYHLPEYKEARKDIGIEFKSAYNICATPNVPYGTLLPYRAGVIEASKWLTIRANAGIRKIALYPEGYRNLVIGLGLSITRSNDLSNLISEHTPFFVFRKEVFIKAKEIIDNQGSVHDFDIFKETFEKSFSLIYSETKKNDVLETINKRQQEKEDKQRKRLEEKRFRAKRKEEERKRGEETRKLKQEERAKTVQTELSERKHKAEQKRERRKWEESLVMEGKGFCRKCEQVLPVDLFSLNAKMHTGRSLYCKPCCKRDHYLPNRDKMIQGTKEWIKAHPDRVRAHRKRSANKPENKIRRNMGRRIKKYLRSSSSVWKDAISCSPKDLVIHLESQFAPTMSWSNYGSFWHIDHIIPCAAFDPSKPNHLKWCWHHKNLRPLSGDENVAKGDLLPNGQYASVLRTQDIEGLKQLVGAELERLGIATAAEYAASWDSPIQISYVTL